MQEDSELFHIRLNEDGKEGYRSDCSNWIALRY